MPTEIVQKIARYADPRARIALADSSPSLHSKLQHERKAAVILTQDVPGVSTGAAFTAVLGRVQQLPAFLQDEPLVAGVCQRSCRVASRALL
jgi:hypothetical protein